jgi:hypothetical protein
MLDRFASRPARLGLSAGLAGLAVVLTLVLTPAGTAAVQALSVFRVTTFKAITFEVDEAALRPTDAQRRQAEERARAGKAAGSTRPGDPLAMREELRRELEAVGIKLDTDVAPDTISEVPNREAVGGSAQTIGPAGLPAAFRQGEPKVYVAGPSATTLTADLDRVRQALRDRAGSMPKGAPAIDPNNLPGIDPNAKRVTATIQTSRSVVQVWGEGETTLVLGQGPSPVLTLDGVEITALRDALLAAPAISKTTQDQLRSIPDDQLTQTLLIPVPTGAKVKNVTVGGLFGVGGEAGLLILTPDGKAGALFWRNGDTLYVVAGGYGEDALMKAAGALQRIR